MCIFHKYKVTKIGEFNPPVNKTSGGYMIEQITFGFTNVIKTCSVCGKEALDIVFGKF